MPKSLNFKSDLKLKEYGCNIKHISQTCSFLKRSNGNQYIDYEVCDPQNMINDRSELEMVSYTKPIPPSLNFVGVINPEILDCLLICLITQSYQSSKKY